MKGVIEREAFLKHSVAAPYFSNLQEALRFDAATLANPALDGLLLRRPCPEEFLEASAKDVVPRGSRLLTMVVRLGKLGIVRMVVTIPENDLVNRATLLPVTVHFARGTP